MTTQPTFKQSRETEIIFAILKGIASREPQVVTYQEIEAETGKRLNDGLRSNIATAIKRLRKECGLVVECDRGIGYRLRPNHEISKSGQDAIERARRVQRVGLEKLNCADRSRMNQQERVEFDVVKSSIELSLLASRPRTIDNVKQMVMRKSNQLDEQEMMEAAKAALMSR